MSLRLGRALRQWLLRRRRETGCDDDETPSWQETCWSLRQGDPDLHELEIDGSTVDDKDWALFTDSLRFSENLQRLILRQVTPSQGRLLAPALKGSKVEALFCENSDDSGGEIVNALAIALFYNRGFDQLHLRDCQLHATLASPALGFLAQSSLTELRLCHTILSLDMTIALSQGLLDNNRLRLLDLTGSRMDDAAVRCLCNGLKTASSGVEFLSLDFNSFGDDGVVALANMLEVNRSLTELHLFGNRVTSVGAEHLSQALTVNDRLQSLILSLNRIGDRGAAALARALTVNSTLANLWFPSNSIGQEGMEAFAEHLPRMNGLESLNVGMLLNCKAEEALTLGLKDNLRLSFLVMEKPVVEEIGDDQDETDVDDGSIASNNNSVNAVMDFYLRLNRSGRRVLRHYGTPSGLWALILAKSSAHARKVRGSAAVPDVLYHLLREIPELAGREQREVSTSKAFML
jgi:hypothetical protein